VKEKNSIILVADVKKRLDDEVLKRNQLSEITLEKLDPIMVAHRHNDETISLICALFSYGNVKQIVKFLDSLDFSLLESSEKEIEETLKNHYYRFQTSEDVIALFIALKRLQTETTLETVFKSGYDKENSVIDGINELIKMMQQIYPYSSRGYDFLISKVTTKTKGAGALKRWMMYLRWMVRDDNIDMGLWSGVDTKDLIIPLDTHTFKVSQKLGLLTRKTYDLQAAIELTCKLKEFDINDPLKYDFALYRIGQEKLLEV
jgi:uncharacterized protein (TIGR02757 family)